MKVLPLRFRNPNGKINPADEFAGSFLTHCPYFPVGEATSHKMHPHRTPTLLLQRNRCDDESPREGNVEEYSTSLENNLAVALCLR